MKIKECEEPLAITAYCRNWQRRVKLKMSAAYKIFMLGNSELLQNRQLRQPANRYA